MKPVIIACSAGLLLTACATDRGTDYNGAYNDGYTTGGIREGSGSQTQWQAGAGTRTQEQYTRQQQYTTSQAGTQQMQGDEVVIPLHEEQLRVGKRTVDAGTVTIRKIVTSETVNQPIELRRESLVIDREGAGAQFQGSAGTQQQGAGVRAQAGTSGAGIQGQTGFDQSEPAGATRATAGTQSSAGAFQEQTYTIQLREEQPIVEKNVVQTGQVVARKTAQTQRQNVQREVRREDVRLDQGSARNVQIRGNFDTAGEIRDPAGAQRQQDTRMQGEIQRDEAQQGQIRTYRSETEIQRESGYQQDGLPVRQGRGAFEDFREGSGTRGGAAGLRGLDRQPE